MERDEWRTEVARLFEVAAEALRARSDRHAVSAFGTAIGYLHKAQARGDQGAAELLAQVLGASSDGPTDRFTFAPGELEALRSGSGKK